MSVLTCDTVMNATTGATIEKEGIVWNSLERPFLFPHIENVLLDWSQPVIQFGPEIEDQKHKC
eukprot:8397170-Ditylum_brightwellii.AAC.1